jgi:mycothiol synthase
MDDVSSRWYCDDHDLERMLALVTASAMHDGLAAGHLHVGDVVWGLFPNETVDPTARIRLFEDDAGALRGFVWLYPPREFGVHADTTMPGVPELLDAMIAWAEGHLETTGDGGEVVPVTPELASTNAPLSEAFEARGYRPVERAVFQLNHQPLGDDLPAPELPPGAEVRPVRLDDPSELEARVALHREVWEPSKFSSPGYARLREKPAYRPDLDLVAVTPEGELAAYCIVWWDPDARTGLFEPVGTAVAHRRRGYARAMMFDALRRLRALGATDALVISVTPESEPARLLYESVGFESVARFERWERGTGVTA